MKLEMQKANDCGRLCHDRWAVALIGKPLDDRGRAAVQYVRDHSDSVVELAYSADDYMVQLDDTSVLAEELIESLRGLLRPPVVLEATTLGFVEVLLCCRCLCKLAVASLDILYVEPQRYRTPRKRNLLHRRDFELSGIVPGYRAIPGFAVLLADRKPQKGVFFLGYEERRLERAFEDMQMIQSSRAVVVFGVPTFRPGWEMDAIANNIAVIREQNIRGGVHFCGAENPASVVEFLRDVRRGLVNGERMFVAPIGTKPHGIGVALFVSEHDDVRVIYDHPHRSPQRSEDVAAWHLYSVDYQ